MRSLKTAIAVAFSVLLGFAPVHAQELAVAAERDQKEYSPYLERGYPQKVFWGDTHVHTSYSTDAGMIGNRLGPDEAYRFARGEIVVSSNGVRAQLQRALENFLAHNYLRLQYTRLYSLYSVEQKWDHSNETQIQIWLEYYFVKVRSWHLQA